jgi:hypothetical protein
VLTPKCRRGFAIHCGQGRDRQAEPCCRHCGDQGAAASGSRECLRPKLFAWCRQPFELSKDEVTESLAYREQIHACAR